MKPTAFPDPLVDEMNARGRLHANRRKPFRWFRSAWRIVRRADAWLGAAVIVLALVVIQSRVWWNEERAARLIAEELAERLSKAAELRRADDARERCDEFKDSGTGARYRWCRLKAKGES